MLHESTTLICPTCNSSFNVLEDEVVPDMECIECGYLSGVDEDLNK